MRWLIIAAAFGVAPGAAAARPNGIGDLSSVAEIDRRCDADAMRATRATPDWIFAKIWDEVGRKGTWHSFRAASELGEATAHGAPDTQAFVWRFPDGVSLVELFLTSQSGDWVHLAAQCFRADGTLARVTDTLNTFYAAGPDGEDDGPVSRIRVRVFGSNGKALQKRSRLLDLRTRKPTRRSYMDQQDVAYLRLSDAPFFHLLGRHGGRRPK
jgi:hypothetical protein